MDEFEVPQDFLDRLGAYVRTSPLLANVPGRFEHQPIKDTHGWIQSAFYAIHPNRQTVKENTRGFFSLDDDFANIRDQLDPHTTNPKSYLNVVRDVFNDSPEVEPRNWEPSTYLSSVVKQGPLAFLSTMRRLGNVIIRNDRLSGTEAELAAEVHKAFLPKTDGEVPALVWLREIAAILDKKTYPGLLPKNITARVWNHKTDQMEPVTIDVYQGVAQELAHMVEIVEAIEPGLIASKSYDRPISRVLEHHRVPMPALVRASDPAAGVLGRLGITQRLGRMGV